MDLARCVLSRSWGFKTRHAAITPHVSLPGLVDSLEYHTPCFGLGYLTQPSWQNRWQLGYSVARHFWKNYKFYISNLSFIFMKPSPSSLTLIHKAIQVRILQPLHSPGESQLVPWLIVSRYLYGTPIRRNEIRGCRLQYWWLGDDTSFALDGNHATNNPFITQTYTLVLVSAKSTCDVMWEDVAHGTQGTDYIVAPRTDKPLVCPRMIPYTGVIPLQTRLIDCSLDTKMVS